MISFKKESKALLINDSINTLKKVCFLRNKKLPNFDKKEIKYFTGLNAQPIIDPFFKDESKRKILYQLIQPDPLIPIFFSNMHCIFPQDRGQNYSIKISKKVLPKKLLNIR